MLKLFKQAKLIRDLEGALRIEQRDHKQTAYDLYTALDNVANDLRGLQKYCIRMGINPAPDRFNMSEVILKEGEGHD